DHDPSSGIIDRWGLVRPDGSARPAFSAFEVASRYLADPSATARLAPFGTPTANGWPVTRVVFDDPLQHTRVQVIWRTTDGPASVNVAAAGTSATLLDPLGFASSAARTDAGWSVPLPPSRVPQASDPPGFESSGYPVLLVESGVPAGAWNPDPPQVTSALGALVAAVVPTAPPLRAIAAQPAQPAQPAQAPAQPTPALAAVPTLVPAITQPGSSLVLNIDNPQPNALLPRARYVMQGQAFDRAARSGSGVDRVSVFLEDRDTGGQHLADATLGQPSATDFTATADLSKSSGSHTLYVYARSAVSGTETVASFPVAIGSR
ncbi:MAG: hypothetical protein JO157_16660, partial [Acetobacteraceae bacterium]|nr:hypothetical protein [Acetobacteraceae bacterium]